jgi:hypothetical protein
MLPDPGIPEATISMFFPFAALALLILDSGFGSDIE